MTKRGGGGNYSDTNLTVKNILLAIQAPQIIHKSLADSYISAYLEKDMRAIGEEAAKKKSFDLIAAAERCLFE